MTTTTEYRYVPAGRIDAAKMPGMYGELLAIRARKKAAHAQVKRLGEQVRNEPLGGNRPALFLLLAKAKGAHGDQILAEGAMLKAIERRANELGLTTIKPARQ